MLGRPGLIGLQGGGLVLDAATRTLLAAMTTQPTRSRKVAIDDMVAALKVGGVWSKLGFLYVFAAADSQAALLNWVSPGITATATSSPTFTVDRGYTGNGSSALINSNYANNALANYTQNNCHVGAYVLWGGGADGPAIGNGGAASYFSIIRTGGALATRMQNTTETIGAAIDNGPNHVMMSRSSGATYTPYVNGAAQSSVTQTSAALASQNFSGLRNLTSYASSNVSLRAMHAGGALTAGQVTALYNAINAYMTAVGANT